MVFKVFYQESLEEAPVRERTRSLFVEAPEERDVRLKLAERNYNIEYIELLSDEFLEYEKKSDQFEVER